MIKFLASVMLVGMALVVAGPGFGQRPLRRTTLEGHSKAVKSVTFSPDGRMLASASDDGTFRVWEVITGKLRATLQNESQQGNFVAFSADGKLLAIGGRFETFNLWNVTSGQQKTKFHTDIVTSVAFSKDGALIAVGGTYNTLKLWDIKTGQEKATLKGHDGINGDLENRKVESVVFNNDGSLLVSGSWDGDGNVEGVRIVNIANRRLVLDSIPQYGTIKLWDVPTGKVKTTIQVLSVPRTLSIAPNGKILAAGSNDGTIKLWDVATGKEKPPLKAHSFRVLSVAFSPDSALLASGGMDQPSGRFGQTIKLLDVKTGEETLTLHGLVAPVSCVAFSPDGRLLASGDSDGKINLWQLPVTAGREKPKGN